MVDVFRGGRGCTGRYRRVLGDAASLTKTVACSDAPMGSVQVASEFSQGMQQKNGSLRLNGEALSYDAQDHSGRLFYKAINHPT
jgi:hypothetical protein